MPDLNRCSDSPPVDPQGDSPSIVKIQIFFNPPFIDLPDIYIAMKKMGISRLREASGGDLEASAKLRCCFGSLVAKFRGLAGHQ